MHPITDPVADIITHRNLARDAGDSNADICFLALADKEGSASVRTLVLRGIQDRGFSVFINQSSPKWQILFSGGHWQLLLWYGSQQKQYRLSGTVNAIDDTIVKESWQYRPLGSKLLDNVYETLAPQSSVLSSRQALLDHLEDLKKQQDIEEVPVPPMVSGAILTADRIERLDLSNPDRIHDRRLFLWQQNNWQSSFLVP